MTLPELVILSLSHRGGRLRIHILWQRDVEITLVEGKDVVVDTGKVKKHFKEAIGEEVFRKVVKTVRDAAGNVVETVL